MSGQHQEPQCGTPCCCTEGRRNQGCATLATAPAPGRQQQQSHATLPRGARGPQTGPRTKPPAATLRDVYACQGCACSRAPKRSVWLHPAQGRHRRHRRTSCRPLWVGHPLNIKAPRGSSASAGRHAAHSSAHLRAAGWQLGGGRTGGGTPSQGARGWKWSALLSLRRPGRQVAAVICRTRPHLPPPPHAMMIGGRRAAVQQYLSVWRTFPIRGGSRLQATHAPQGYGSCSESGADAWVRRCTLRVPTQVCQR